MTSTSISSQHLLSFFPSANAIVRETFRWMKIEDKDEKASFEHYHLITFVFAANKRLEKTLINSNSYALGSVRDQLIENDAFLPTASWPYRNP